MYIYSIYVYKNKNFRVASAVTSPCYLTNRVPAIHISRGYLVPRVGGKRKILNRD